MVRTIPENDSSIRLGNVKQDEEDFVMFDNNFANSSGDDFIPESSTELM